jgi:acetyl-CoA carboxylase biotin carboxylase subunit
MKRLLIANRGEIALRILRACRTRGIETVAVYTSVDASLGYLDLADDRVCIGRQSYLEGDQIISAALAWQCDALHPGYGFLSENADFARDVEAAGLNYVGPTPEAIALMADKSSGRRSMAEAGVPVLPGSDDLTSIEDAIRQAGDMGYPVMLKASHGGGGRGMSVLGDEAALVSVFESLRSEADAAFSNGALYLERYMDAPRHIEIQVAGDGAGAVIHLGARECSIQRRHQKLLEEAPPPGIDSEVIDALASDCCDVLSAMKYRSLGTLEFLYQDGSFYFIEMNTRIQVEHPVTEAVCDIDLVDLQLQIADSGKLPLQQAEISLEGHAIECRINAEDSEFRPSPGEIDRLRLPGGPGVRFDSHIYQGYSVSHHYDSMIGKLIGSGVSREVAISRMRAALTEMDLGSLGSNLPLHREIMDDPRFLDGSYNTRFLGSA